MKHGAFTIVLAGLPITVPSLAHVRALVRFSLPPVLGNLRACVLTVVVVLDVVAPMGEASAASKEESMAPVSQFHAKGSGRSAVCGALDPVSMVQDHV